MLNKINSAEIGPWVEGTYMWVRIYTQGLVVKSSGGGR